MARDSPQHASFASRQSDLFAARHRSFAFSCNLTQLPRPMPPATRYPISDHCDGRVFRNPDLTGVPSLREIIRWKLSSRPARWPKNITTRQSPRPSLAADGIRATWINHATFLLETPQGNFLTDPVYSTCCGPFGRIGPRRVHAPGIPLRDLPEIHFVLLSHDHYDHCDLPTLRLLSQAHEPLAITPLGNHGLVARAGFSRIIELDWWQTHTHTPNLSITVTPTQHWSNRLSGGRYSRLWGGFFIKAGGRRLYFVGDTGYNSTLFTGIGRKLGPPDLAMIPIGAYEPRWFMREQHCNPAEAVQIHCDVGAHTSLAMHWGTFQLTDEGRDEPPRALSSALAEAHISPQDFQIMEPGGSLVLSS
jgi:L-ascorbate metabolism protein UlaG (beta-lactamase superfamily)